MALSAGKSVSTHSYITIMHSAMGATGNKETRKADNFAAATGTTTSTRTSCDRCGVMKRKCDGNGVNPCSRCIRKRGVTRCTYSKRKPKHSPLQPPTYSGIACSTAAAFLQSRARTRCEDELQHCRVQPLKRCRLSASPATGLVGMQENVFLSNYFGCLTFLRCNESNIREAMVILMTTPTTWDRRADGNSYAGDHMGTSTLASSAPNAVGDCRPPMSPSTCVFWSAVALGALLEGRPLESVTGYVQLAKDALESFSGQTNAALAKVWITLAFLHGMSGNMAGFQGYMQKIEAYIRGTNENESTETLPRGFAEIVKRAESFTCFYGEPTPEEVDSFRSQDLAPPQMQPNIKVGGDGAEYWNALRMKEGGRKWRLLQLARDGRTVACTTAVGISKTGRISGVVMEDDILRFASQSFIVFEQAAYSKVFEQKSSSSRHGVGTDFEASDASEDANFTDTPGEKPPHPTAPMPILGPTPSSRALNALVMGLRERSSGFAPLEQATDRSIAGAGVSGLAINIMLFFDKVFKKKGCDAVERLSRCIEVVERYPGLCRLTMGSHVAHIIMAALAKMTNPTARELYDKLRAIYNPMTSPGSVPFPPFEEWQGIAPLCSHFYCRLMEQLLASDGMSCSSSFPLHTDTAGKDHYAPLNREDKELSPAISRFEISSSCGSSGGFHSEAASSWRSNVDLEDVIIAGADGYRSTELAWTTVVVPEEKVVSEGFRLLEDVLLEEVGASDVDGFCETRTVLHCNDNGCSDEINQAAEVPSYSGFSERVEVDSEAKERTLAAEDWFDFSRAMMQCNGPDAGLE